MISLIRVDVLMDHDCEFFIDIDRTSTLWWYQNENLSSLFNVKEEEESQLNVYVTVVLLKQIVGEINWRRHDSFLSKWH